MYSLIQVLGWKHLAVTEAPALGASLVLAELFYKFHSFTLECAAFLATWCAISYLFSLASGSHSGRQ